MYTIGSHVILTGNITVELADVTANIAKGTAGRVVAAHEDNAGLEFPMTDALFLIEFPERFGYRLWCRAWRFMDACA